MVNYRRGGGRGRRAPVQVQEDTHRINTSIRVPEVRVVDDAGRQLGVMPTSHALKLAEDKDLDLVEVAPNAKPPVCKFMDYGKFKYKEQKKEAEAKKKRSETSIKELRIRYRTDSGDLETKLKKAREFLAEGDKVKFSMRFRGREVMYLELGLEKFEEIIGELSDVADVDERSPARGRQIYVVLTPSKGATVSKGTADKGSGASKPKASAATESNAQDSGVQAQKVEEESESS
ncbi:MAG: translation initiation factor IF-3, partial [Bdellovibrionales bacterium]|nr:translation initiation factor IF-3 [Bdellovibrionales bacterium]